jgi:hypothetical protein
MALLVFFHPLRADLQQEADAHLSPLALSGTRTIRARLGRASFHTELLSQSKSF